MSIESKLERDVRWLKRYGVGISIVFGVFLLTAFVVQDKKQKFEEIDVERVNIVEKDGKLGMVIANGTPKINFYDETGKVVYTLPEEGKPVEK